MVWLAFLDVGQSLKELVGDLNIRFDVQFLVVQLADIKMQLFEVYRVAPDTPLRVQLFGTRDGPLHSPAHVYHRRRSLGGYVMKTASLNTIFHRESDVFQNSYLVSVNNDIIGGFYGKVWAVLERHLNFKSTVSVPATGLWGSKDDNGAWNGVVGMVTRREAEVGVSDVTMTSDRVGVLSYSMQVATFHYKVVIRAGEVNVSWDNFLRPFSTGLWTAITIYVVVMAFALKIYFEVGLVQGKEEPRDQTLQDWLLATFGAVFCSQGQASTPLSFQCRLVYILSYTLGFVIFCAYSAAVVSFLAVHDAKLPVTNIQQLQKDESYTIRTVNGSSTLEAFRQSTAHDFMTLYKERLKPHLADMPRNVLEGLQRVCRERRYAFMVPKEETLEYLPHLSCEVVYLPQGIFEMKYAFVFNVDSPYIGLFRYTLQKLLETGIMEKLHQDTMIYEPRKSEGAFKSMELVDVVPVFSISTSGIVVAIFLVFLEQLFSWILERRN
ncbi:hypothetical protein B7P43_G04078 [Cryptotermes secundus]|uniref:Ionotropic glutamate receptor L-glutamate and glycine-binding domain-containing protein n=1 Tax=Cryptotermes secundus TaxID=105785 RepID=A0A2J7QS62_9NEOP|nr:hypothetical protein B7P43_G04078 [Cryptotermes secundus]